MLFVAVAGLVISNAQTKKGTWLVGANIGSINFGGSNSDSKQSTSASTTKIETHNFNISLSPYGGYFFTDKIVAGGGVSFSYSHSKTESRSSTATSKTTGEGHTISAGLGPFARFYLGKLNDRGMPYAEVGLGITFYPGYKGSNESATPSNNYEYTYKSYALKSAAIRLGYEHFLNRSFGLQYSIGYVYSRTSYKVDYDYAMGSDFSSEYTSKGGSVAIAVGLALHLDCEKTKVNSSKKK
jgi:hypothetical protein